MPQELDFEYDVFLSFSIHDTEIAKDIWKKLTEFKLSVFWSDATLKKEAGDSWFERIEESLERSQHMVVLITEDSLKSNWVLREYRAFLNSCYIENTRRLIPLLDQGIKVSDMPLFMRELQSFSMDDADAIQYLGEMFGEHLSERKQEQVHGEYIDPRDKNKYRTINIGGQVWFAENLNYISPESKIFSKNNNYKNNYGRLYCWEDAQGSCPPGCCIPGNNDWEELLSSIGGSKVAGAVLVNGDFSARFAGMALRDNFDYFGQHAYFWSSSEFDESRAFSFTLFKDEMSIQKDIRRKELFFSVRCRVMS